MSSKQLFGCMGAAFGVVSGLVGGLAWSNASAHATQRTAQVASAAKKAKNKLAASQRARAARLAATVRAQKARVLARRKQKTGKTPPSFRRIFRVKATAYCPLNSRMEGGRWTATRRDGRSAHGIAVDPRLIPLGTRLWVPGYGHAIADDTGGAIRGHHIDVRLQNREAMHKWGVRSLRVYVLADPAS